MKWESYIKPSKIDAERAVLGRMILCPDACNTAVDLLCEEDFSIDLNRALFASIKAIRCVKIPLALSALQENLKDLGYEHSWTATEIAKVLTATPAASGNVVETYANIMLD